MDKVSSRAGVSGRAHRSQHSGKNDGAESYFDEWARRVDPLGMTTSVLKAQMAWLMHPKELAEAMEALSGDILALQSNVMRRAFGLPTEPVVEPKPDDARFSDPVWRDSPTWDVVKEWYLLYTHRLQDMFFEAPGLSDQERTRAAFWLREWLNAVAPTNYFWTNPVALRHFVDSGGESLVKGFENFLRDVKAKNVLMVEPDAFKVGRDLATTQGKVVARNRLIELIRYTPTTEKVHETPIVIVTPWINKYYILDLNESKSLVKYLVDQGFTVFITSWVNPTAEMSGVSYEDYLIEGVHFAVESARAIVKTPQVHAVGYCIGGTTLAAYMAWANRKYGEAGKVPVAHWTLLTSLTDFSKPGDIDVFVDEASVSWLEASMREKGFLDGAEMATSFRLLRSNSLIWHYVEHSYLYGEALPPFDVLYWNMDATRMPCEMHSYYLREFYLNNNLVKHDELKLGGELIDLERIVQPLYAVTAEDDHIAPWRQCYRIREYLDAPVRFVQSSSGHIFGVINPPVNPPKRRYRVGEPMRNDGAEDWLAAAEKCMGSWWPDWSAWLSSRCGPMVSPSPMSSKDYPVLADAPGAYVLEK